MSKPEKERLRTAQPAQLKSEHFGGNNSLAPPSFQLNASPLQMRSSFGKTNYRFDTGKITGRDLQDPEIVERLGRMSIEGLKYYMKMVQDPEVIAYIEGLILDLSPPEAAAIEDKREKVLPAQRAMYDQLRDFVVALPGRISTLLSAPPKGYEYLKDNPNVTPIVALVNEVAADLKAERRILRFDNSLTGGNVAASYVFTTDTINVRPIASADDLGVITASLLHEYQHHKQDVEIENAVKKTGNRHEHNREEEIDHEVEGRKSGVYTSKIMQALGEFKGADFNAMVNDEVFKGRFEKERTGTKAEKKAATKEIRKAITEAYTKQLDENSPSATYRAVLGKNNHVTLNLPSGDRDLGIVPSTAKTPDELSTHLEKQMRAQPDAASFFKGSKKSIDYKIITVLVYHEDRKLAEFAMKP